MNYFYAILWFAAGLVQIFSISKENKVFYFSGAFFLLLGGWWLADALLPEVDLFSGVWGVAFRCVCGVALVALTAVFLLERKKMIKKSEEEKKKN